MLHYIRNWLFDILIKYLSRELRGEQVPLLSKEEYDGLFSQLWQTTAFRKYVADRDAKILYTMAGGEGMEPEPRDKYVMHSGQRVENLLLAREAKAAYQRVELRNQSKVVKAQDS